MSSHDMKNPNGGVHMGHVIEPPDPNSITFLGFSFRGTKIYWSEKAFREFKRRVKLLTGRSWFVSIDYRFKKLTQYIRGWMNYFGISEYYRPIPELDHWLPRRVRMCYWKQWRLCHNFGSHDEFEHLLVHKYHKSFSASYFVYSDNH